MPSERDITLTVLGKLHKQLYDERVKLNKVKHKSRDKIAYSFPLVMYDDLRYRRDGMMSPSIRWVRDGRKQSESANSGTGVYAYYDPTTDTWRRFDNTEVEK